MLDTSVVNATATNGAQIEIATIRHEGHECTATGSIIDTERGYILGYVRDLERGRYELVTWAGDVIAGTLRRVSSWQRWTHFGLQRMEAYAFVTPDGTRYHGRKSADWDALNLRSR